MSGFDRTRRARAVKLLGLAVFSTSLIVGFAEFRKPPPKRAGYSAAVAPEPGGANALTYVQLRHTQRGPSRAVYLEGIESLRARLPALSERFVRKPGDRERMLEARAALRAFDGAPPTVPHPVDERAIPNCAVCHEHGALIGQLRAPAMSHAPMSSCVQCHVSQPEAHGSPVALPATTVGNDFVAQAFGGLGTRAWMGAPPVRPHPRAMRNNCASCHGVAGDPGLRTSHPDRQNCEQCHAGPEGSEHPTNVVARFGGAL